MPHVQSPTLWVFSHSHTKTHPPSLPPSLCLSPAIIHSKTTTISLHAMVLMLTTHPILEDFMAGVVRPTHPYHSESLSLLGNS